MDPFFFARAGNAGAVMPPCRHCKRRPADSPGGLCAACFARPEIRLLYQRGFGPRPARPSAPRRYRPQKHPR